MKLSGDNQARLFEIPVRRTSRNGLYTIARKYRLVCYTCGRDYMAARKNSHFCCEHCENVYYAVKSGKRKNFIKMRNNSCQKKVHPELRKILEDASFKVEKVKLFCERAKTPGFSCNNSDHYVAPSCSQYNCKECPALAFFNKYKHVLEAFCKSMAGE